MLEGVKDIRQVYRFLEREKKIIMFKNERIETSGTSSDFILMADH